MYSFKRWRLKWLPGWQLKSQLWYKEKIVTTPVERTYWLFSFVTQLHLFVNKKHIHIWSWCPHDFQPSQQNIYRNLMAESKSRDNGLHIMTKLTKPRDTHTIHHSSDCCREVYDSNLWWFSNTHKYTHHNTCWVQLSSIKANSFVQPFNWLI